MSGEAMTAPAEAVETGLVKRLREIKADHLRLATWNRGKDRPARVAFHHDAALAIDQAIQIASLKDKGP